MNKQFIEKNISGSNIYIYEKEIPVHINKKNFLMQYHFLAYEIVWEFSSWYQPILTPNKCPIISSSYDTNYPGLVSGSSSVWLYRLKVRSHETAYSSAASHK